jgi:hypothetical protein
VTLADLQAIRGRCEKDVPRALRNLRHLYEQLMANAIGKQPAAAIGLLGPAIEVVENLGVLALLEEVERLTVCLTRANADTEHFARNFYLATDEVERLRGLLSQACCELEDTGGAFAASAADGLRKQLNKDEQSAKCEMAEGSAVVFVLFPNLETRGPATIREIAAHLQQRGQTVWVADEADHERRLKALYVRELYGVGPGASIVMTNSDGVCLDGWYDEARLPTIDELIAQASRHAQRRVTAPIAPQQ